MRINQNLPVTVILGTQEAVGRMDVIITRFLIFLPRCHMKTTAGQNEWLALCIWHLVGQVPYLVTVFLRPSLGWNNTHTHTHTCLTALCPGLHGWASTRIVKPFWILLEQETVSGSGISSAICKSAPRSRQTTTPVPHHWGGIISRQNLWSSHYHVHNSGGDFF